MVNISIPSIVNSILNLFRLILEGWPEKQKLGRTKFLRRFLTISHILDNKKEMYYTLYKQCVFIGAEYLYAIVDPLRLFFFGYGWSLLIIM